MTYPDLNPTTWTGTILLVDSYDSYIFNIYGLIKKALPRAHLIIIRNDEFNIHTLRPFLNAFDWCVLGPGPGSPACEKDIGILPNIWNLPKDQLLPTFGICLGMQTLCLNFGGRLRRLEHPAHGIISEIHFIQDPLFNDHSTLSVVRYHSFCVDITPEFTLKPLGWAHDIDGPVLMAVRHPHYPFYGVQYHPESLFSTQGVTTILNFWKIAIQYNQQHRTVRTPLKDNWHYLYHAPLPLIPPPPVEQAHHKFNNKIYTNKTNNIHHFLKFQLDISTIEIAEYLHLEQYSSCAILDSAVAPGRFSILGVPSEGQYTLTYTFPDTYLIKTYTNQQEHIELGKILAWEWIANELQKWEIHVKLDIPFYGGFIGYLSYEYGVYTANIANATNIDSISCEIPRRRRPDVNLLFFERSIVLDTTTKQVVVQSLIHNDPWVMETAALLQNVTNKITTVRISSKDSNHTTTVVAQSPLIQNSKHITQIIFPDKKEYLEKIHTAQSYISHGESYELCLTSTTRVFSSKPCTPTNDWCLYKRLRALNPAPFAGYLRLEGVTLLSSSPERFLSWSRDGSCELRPIKGTIPKDPSIDFEKATILLKNPKDCAENLMILDLIRNDLYQVAKNVHVPIPMQVEEYETVYQLVSVIRGTADPPYTGIDILAHTLPPGSMTGAPKKRSIELLDKLEGNQRDVYSGVFGYFSVSGEGDWSVIIRSTFRYHDEDHWNIGAGGAITTLSNPKNEWDEMTLKLQSILPLFEMNERKVKIT
ncbi:hypothetical protein PCANB_000693 [Pneumocystis canis]|nr:hypothetical protein PCK1_000677 [Pneumocystis canis]KAG5437656.1 hypothetical protein PCANB_000693 [Pneumocystis canis]